MDKAPNYRQGAIYSLATAGLLAVQEPFSALAARRLPTHEFFAFTQVALLLSIPLMLGRPNSRRDFGQILLTPRHWPKLIVLFAVGCAGLGLYDVALSSTHPIITAAILNLSPFWAALVARTVSGKRLPPPRSVFLGCFVVAFLGAMILALSQIETDSSALKRDLLYSLFHSRWALALPMPVFFALSGTLVYQWFRKYDEGAAIAANFLLSALLLIPGAIFFARGAELPLTAEEAPAIALLLIGTLASSATGRLFYQAALTETRNDNGFVTMFFLAIPVISIVISWPMSRWITVLKVHFSAQLFEGLVMVIAPLAIFSFAAMTRRNDQGP